MKEKEVAKCQDECVNGCDNGCVNGSKVYKENKLSYEDLETLASQLSEQNRHLYKQLQEVTAFNAFKRLDYLFKVIENTKVFKKEFVETCANEIVDVITVSDSEVDVEGEEEDNNK